MVGGWCVGIAPFETLVSPVSVSTLTAQMALGIVAALPMLVGFFFFERQAWKPVVEVRSFLGEHLIPHLRSFSVAELAMVSACAGIGEEALFRGLLQSWMTSLGAGAAIVISSLLFGFMHPITKLYVTLAFAAGLYLGWLWFATEHILVPIVAHGMYDFVALVWIVRYRAKAYVDATN